MIFPVRQTWPLLARERLSSLPSANDSLRPTLQSREMLRGRGERTAKPILQLLSRGRPRARSDALESLLCPPLLSAFAPRPLLRPCAAAPGERPWAGRRALVCSGSGGSYEMPPQKPQTTEGRQPLPMKPFLHFYRFTGGNKQIAAVDPLQRQAATRRTRASPCSTRRTSNDA
jgi:hypothetical protein